MKRDVRSDRGSNIVAMVGSLFLGLLLGTMIGGTVGLLGAPHSGAKTRKRIRRQATRIRNRAQGAVLDAQSRVGR